MKLYHLASEQEGGGRTNELCGRDKATVSETAEQAPGRLLRLYAKLKVKCL